MEVEIVQTPRGCRYFVKTFETNAYNKNKFVKTLKFYQDQKMVKQIIVDEGYMDDQFHIWDISTLHFGENVIFYAKY